jgi:hypothetical protein
MRQRTVEVGVSAAARWFLEQLEAVDTGTGTDG